MKSNIRISLLLLLHVQCCVIYTYGIVLLLRILFNSTIGLLLLRLVCVLLLLLEHEASKRACQFD